MRKDVPRCPYCAAAMPVKEGWWDRWWPFGKKQTYCKMCRKAIANDQAEMMGQAYGHWVREFQLQLAQAVKHLPVLETNPALRAIQPGLGLEEIRRVASIESLAHFAATVYRPVLKDQAQGRNAELTVVVLQQENTSVAVGILGRTSAETGEKETELLFSRVGPELFLAYLPVLSTRRIKDAIRAVRLQAMVSSSPHSPALPAV